MKLIRVLCGLALWLTCPGCGGKAESIDGRDAEGDAPVPGSEEGDPPRADAPGLPVGDCEEGLLGASMVRGLAPADRVDAVSFVALDREHYVSQVVEQWGEACEDSGVGSACLLEIEERQTGFYRAESDFAHALIISKEGEHEALGYVTLREFLGEIDTANEAAVLAWSEGWAVDCSDIRVADDGYWIADRLGCNPDDHWVRVAADGSVSHSAHCVEPAP